MLLLQLPKVEAFVRYRTVYAPRIRVEIDPLLLLPGGVALRALPKEPLLSPSAIALRTAVGEDDTGTWTRKGNTLTLSFGKDREVFAAYPKGGWYVPKTFRKATPRYNVYAPVRLLTPSILAGRWTMRSADRFDPPGLGRTTMVAGEKGQATFRPDGTFAQREQTFVGSTATASDEGATVGTWRLLSLFLVTTIEGRTRYRVAFAMPNRGTRASPEVMIAGDSWTKR